MAQASVRPATPEDFATFFPKLIEGHALLVEGSPQAMGLLLRGDDGRLMMTLDIKAGAAGHAIHIIRATRAVLARQSEAVFTDCQSHAFPEAERLLALIGFVPTDEFSQGMRVWIWQQHKG